jgi:hypothetical protein
MKLSLIRTISTSGGVLIAVAFAWPNASFAQDYAARLSASPASYKGSCPAKISFKGVVSAKKVGSVQYKFIRSDGAMAPIQTIKFSKPGDEIVETTWTLGGASLPTYAGWQAIEIVYPTSLTSNKAEFKVACSFEDAGASEQATPQTAIAVGNVIAVARAFHLPDLMTKLAAPATGIAGQELKPPIVVAARNSGKAKAPGTASRPDGYMIDVVLSTDKTVPPGFKTYSAHFSEDVMLLGGRISNTVDLDPGKSHTFAKLTGSKIPADTPSGHYYVCALVDSGDKVKESDETNNVYCRPITIKNPVEGSLSANERTPLATIGVVSTGQMAAMAQALQLPDLMTKLSAPQSNFAGQELKPPIVVAARNAGKAKAPGTASGSDGYMIDVVLSTDKTVPSGFKTYSAHFSEDVMLLGGRISNTVDLDPGMSHTFAKLTGSKIPADTPPGHYYICALVDSGDKVKESNENNNVYCSPISVKPNVDLLRSIAKPTDE